MSIEIIAEIAQGYEGRPELAYLLARAGVCSGADSVKFQCVYADDTCVPGYKHYAFFKQLEMPESVWREIHRIVSEGGRKLILNIGGDVSLRLAKAIGVTCVKLHSTHFFCTQLIGDAIREFDKVYMSIGGISVEEMAWFMQVHNLKPDSKVSFTYGFQSSPTPVEKNNLSKIAALKDRFPGFSFGFEDHTDAFSDDRFIVSPLALAYGVSHIERHLTLDPLLKLEDAESALSATDFLRFVDLIRRLEPSLGSGDLALTDIEHDYRGRVLKVAVAATDLKAGRELTLQDVALKRSPETVTSPYLRVEDLLGKRLLVDLPVHSAITKEMVQ